MKLLFTEEFGKAFTPKRVRPHLREYLLKAGITKQPYSFFGVMFYLTLISTFLIYFLGIYPYIVSYKESMARLYYLLFFFFATFVSWVLVMLFQTSLIMMFIYFYIDMKIFNRTRKLEEILPEFLQNVSSNLKGGMSFEKSLWASIKPEYGILAGEIRIAAKKVMTGQSVKSALNEFARKYDSPMLKRTIELIVGEIESGGKIADIIDDLVKNLKKTKELKDELTTSVLSYVIFIAVVVIIISPVLFSLSYNLLIIISKIIGIVGSSTASATNMPFNITNVNFDTSSFIYFSYAAIGIIALFSSIITSIIEKGNIKGGLKYIPIFLISSMALFIVFLKIFTKVFANMIHI